MKTIGITGGTGFIGQHLAEQIRKGGDEVIIFTRDPEHHRPEQGIRYVYWCAEENKCDLAAIKNIDAVIHLAGAGIADKRWTQKRKKEIVDSRVKGTRFLISKLKEYAGKCKVLVSASAIGYYGPDRGNAPFIETDKPYHDFLAKTCVDWEYEALQANGIMRTVIFRFGIVLGKDGGAYKEMAKPARFGIIPILGSGRQAVSWIHVNDLVQLLLNAVNNQQLNGIYNAVAPQTVTHKQLMKTIASQKGGINISVPVPAAALEVLLGEMSIEVLKSCTVSAEKIQQTGFDFSYPTIDRAIGHIIRDKHNR